MNRPQPALRAVVSDAQTVSSLPTAPLSTLALLDAVEEVSETTGTEPPAGRSPAPPPG